MPQPKLFSVIDKAVYDYNMIEKGDRILIGASGGKDSTALVEYFANRSRRPNAGFTYTAVHIETDFASCGMNPRLMSLFSEWNVDYKTIFVDVMNRLKEGHKMSCYWCSSQRRNELMHYAMNNGYNKLVLGHHMDDILETLIMNIMGKSELSTMPPRLKYENYPLTLLRPLCYADIKMIVEHAKAAGYICTTCTCDYQDNSGRKDARRRLEGLSDGEHAFKEKMFNALRNIKSEYLP